MNVPGDDDSLPGEDAPIGESLPADPSRAAGTQAEPVGDTEEDPRVERAGPSPAPVGTVDYLPAAAADSPSAGEIQVGPWDTTVLRSAPAVPEGQEAAVPRQVAGYDILGVLGRGAMGVVYKARQRGLKRLVALKMILAGGHAGERELVRFRTEAEAVARLHHPNIVQIYEVSEENGLPFFSLEFVEGDSLARKIAGTPQPPREAARLLHLLAGAMACAHEQGIVHRDLKPANILMTLDGEPKITDFGLAKRLEEDTGQTHSGTIMGTPSYMPPEQADGRIEEVGPLSDVYSLGALLYELLTGRVPFRAPTIRETLAQVREQEPVAPTQLQPKVPRDLETICLKCLQKEARKRYASAGALAEDLRRFLAHEPIQARPVGRIERTWRWCRRNPLGAAVVLLVTAWACTMSALAWGLKVQKDETDKARVEAGRQANLAREERAQALASERQATRSAQEAQRQYAGAVQQVVGLSNDLQKELRSRRLTEQAGPGAAALRETLLRTLRKRVTQMAKDLEGAGVTTFGVLAAYQSLGDLRKSLGEGEEALKLYREGDVLSRRLIQEHPDDDKARANRGIMLLRLGDMELELHGDARAACERYREARTLQEEIAQHPRSGAYSEADNHRLVSVHVMALGKGELEQGNPAAARDCFQQALTLRQTWVKLEPQSVRAKSFLSEVYLWLGVVHRRLGNDKESREAFDRALEMVGSLVKQFPGDFTFQDDLAEVQGYLGDALFRSGQTALAEKTYRLALQNRRAVADHFPDEVLFRPLLARALERLAAAAVRSDRREEAQELYETALALREELLGIEANNRTWRAAHLLTLAHCRRHADAAAKAEQLIRKAPESVPLALQAARCFAACAAAAPDAGTKRQYTEKAAGALRAAVAAGCKDLAALRTDPDLAPVAQDPACRTLLAGPAPR
jgi:tetratricopeptide (TPR) repeat protein